MKVFISSPYSADSELYFKKQISNTNLLMDLGFTPFAPLLYHPAACEQKRDYQEWLDMLMEWLRVCDVVFCTGVSAGVTAEIEEADRLGIPVVFTITELKDFYKKFEKSKTG